MWRSPVASESHPTVTPRRETKCLIEILDRKFVKENPQGSGHQTWSYWFTTRKSALCIYKSKQSRPRPAGLLLSLISMFSVHHFTEKYESCLCLQNRDCKLQSSWLLWVFYWLYMALGRFSLDNIDIWQVGLLIISVAWLYGSLWHDLLCASWT